MSAANGTAPDLEQLREQTRIARAQAKYAQAKHEQQLWESFIGSSGFGMGWGEYLNPYGFRRDDFGGVWLPLGQQGVSRTQDGRNAPFVMTDADLDRQRSLANWITQNNDLAIGVVSTLRNFTIKRGYDWDARPEEGYEEDSRALYLAAQVKQVITNHAKVNKLKSRERSSFWRAVRDGEAITRHFAQDDGTTVVRPIRAEQLRDPGTYGPHCSFGIETDPHDVETVTHYHVTYDGTEYERVPAHEVCHLKRNVDEEIKRGVSDFFSAGEAFDDVAKLLKSMRRGAGLLARIAWIEQHKNSTQSQITAHVAAGLDRNRPRFDDPRTGKRVDQKTILDGTVVHTGENTEYAAPPLAGNTANFTQIVQACLRAAGVRWGLPEYVTSGDASNANLASLLVSGSPMVNAVECTQDDFGEFFLRWHWIAVRNACDAGLISAPFEEVQRLVAIHYTPPLVAIANEGEQSTVDHADIAAGVMSLQTRRARRKLDNEQEKKNLEEEPPTRVSGKATDLDDKGNPVQRGNSQPLGRAPGQPPASDDGKPGGGGLAAMLGESRKDEATLLREQFEEHAELLQAIVEGTKRQDGEEWTTGNRIYTRQGGKTTWKSAGHKNTGGDGGGSSPDAQPKPAKEPKPKSPAKEKPAKLTAEEAYHKIAAMMQDRKAATADDVDTLSKTLMGMTVDQIKEVQARLGIRAGGAKAERAKKVAQQVMGVAEPKTPRAKPQPPEPGFTGVDSHGHHWVDGKQVKKPQEAKDAKHHPALVDALGKMGVELTPELLADPAKLADAIRRGASKQGADDERTGRGGRAGSADAADGGPVAGTAGEAGRQGPDRGGDAGGEPAGDATDGGVPAEEKQRKERVAADAKRVLEKLDRFKKLFGDRGNHHAADFMEKLRAHVEAVGPEAALASLGGEVKGKGSASDVGYTASEYWSESMGDFTKAYLDRHGIIPVGEMTAPGKIVAPGTDKYAGFTPTDQPTETPYQTKLDEAKDLPGLETTEDLAVIMGGKEGEATPHLTPEVTAKLDERYGKNGWIIKTYGDDAFAGQGIFFSQRAEKMTQDARATIWNAGSALDKYGFKLARNPDTGEVFGLQHESGDTYQFGTEEYEKTIDGDAKQWAERARGAAANEKGAGLPNEGRNYMVQPAFPVVGVSEADRAAGKTIVKGEGRVHVVVRNGKAEVIPHSTWLKNESLPIVFEDDDSRAMAKAAQEAIDALPEKARKGQLYAPDVVKTKDGYKVVELNASVDEGGGSGYLQDNPFVIDAYVSHLTGREPGHVQFIRNLLTARKGEKKTKGGE